MKVADLSGEELDKWVAKAEGYKREKTGDDLLGVHIALYQYYPSVDWSDGGPIIEREHIQIIPRDGNDMWSAYIDEKYPAIELFGETPLIAAMRERFHLIETRIYDNDGDLVKMSSETVLGDYELTESEIKYQEWLEARRNDQ